jgi:CHAD domain-containing protein
VDTGAPRAVHRARVALRRLRELVPVLQLANGATQKLGRKLRKTRRKLGYLRELDVLLRLTEELQASRPDAQSALRLIAADLRIRRQDGWSKLMGRQIASELRQIDRRLRAVSRRVEKADVGRRRPQPWRWAIDLRVGLRAANLSAAIEEAGAVYFADRLHNVRIALKKLRYGMELAAEVSVAAGPDLKTLRRGQTLLGRMHDFQVLIDDVRRFQGGLTPPDLTIWHQLDALLVSLEDHCRRLHGRYVRQRPALVAVCERLTSRTSSSERAARIG